MIISSPVFIILAFSFAKPQSPRDWRSFGAFSAFVVALFAEMYGFPLTIYLLAGWLTSRFPGIDWMTHDGGHLLEMTLGWRTDPHFGPFHVLSFIFIGGGFWLLAAAWRVLYRAQRAHHLVTTYVLFAKREERDMDAGFTVTVHDSGNVAARAKAGIATRCGSCHTALTDGYAIEGHVPVREIHRLLQERPAAIGLAVPGMVIGSPGMEQGGRVDPYTVLLLHCDGGSSSYAKYRG